jgi:aryl-alcohol dehydrogenase-like predicted oxidoreductase
VDEGVAHAVLDAAVGAGVTFVDTADMYGDGRSEQLIGPWLAGHRDAGVMVATKIGSPGGAAARAVTADALRSWTDRSRTNLGVDTLDLVQLHCPPTPIYSTDRVFDVLDAMVAEERIARYGVSVETCDEALAAITRPRVASIQIVLNALRLRRSNACCLQQRRPVSG